MKLNCDQDCSCSQEHSQYHNCNYNEVFLQHQKYCCQRNHWCHQQNCCHQHLYLIDCNQYNQCSSIVHSSWLQLRSLSVTDTL